MAVISAGEDLLKERPSRAGKPITITGGSLPTGEDNMVAVDYDQKLKCLWVVGEANKKLLRVNPETGTVIAHFDYPLDLIAADGTRMTKSLGLACFYENNESYVMFLCRSAANRLQLYKLKANTDTGLTELIVENYFAVQEDSTILWGQKTGLTIQGFDLYALGGNNGDKIYQLNDIGQIIASYNIIEGSEGLCVVNGSFYTGNMDFSSGVGYLDKYTSLEPRVNDRFSGQEPFVYGAFTGDICSNIKQMWVVTGDRIYIYNMKHYTYIVDNKPTLDINFEVVATTEEKIIEAKFKNIADRHAMEQITISIPTDPNNDADDMMYLSIDGGQTWGKSISYGQMLGISGEFVFHLKAAPPAEADSNLNPRVAALLVAYKLR